MNEAPVPKPRTTRSQTVKKPIPLPRQKNNLINNEIILENIETNNFQNGNEDNLKKSSLDHSFNDKFCEKKRLVQKTVLEHSKLISDEIKETKKNVLEISNTVKKSMVKKFGSFSREKTTTTDGKDEQYERTQSLPPSSEIFSTLKFKSPLVANSLINNKDAGDDLTDHRISFPPPSEPPPLLPDDSLYDEPQPNSGSSSSYYDTLSSITSDRLKYEEICLLSSSEDSSKHNPNISRSQSWAFHDGKKSDEKEKHIYANEPEDTNFKITAENLQRLSELSSISVPNSLYENHILQPVKVNSGDSASNNSNSSNNSIRNSTIYEFDPLKKICVKLEEENDLEILESILTPDSQYKVKNEHESKWERFDDDDEDLNVVFDEAWEEASSCPLPPEPPVRFDSLTENSKETNDKKAKTEIPDWFKPSVATNFEKKDKIPEAIDVKIEPNEDKKQETAKDVAKANSIKQRLSGVFQKFKVNEGTRSNLTTKLSFRNKTSDEQGVTHRRRMIPKPRLVASIHVTHQGPLLKIGKSGGVEDFFSDVNPRWCHMGDGKIFCYTDNTLKSLKETIVLNTLLSIQAVTTTTKLNQKNQNSSLEGGDDNEEYHCFEVITSVKGVLKSRHVFGVKNKSDRRLWLQKLIEYQTTIFPINLTCDFIMTGWAYLKQGTSGEWKAAWLLLQHRTLYFKQVNDVEDDSKTLVSIDLRKARCIVLQEIDPDTPKTDDDGPQLLVDCEIKNTNESGSIYIRAQSGRATCAWRNSIKAAAHNNGASLESKQLTQNDIPVIVYKCVNFIYTHGSLSEGIYRRSGSNKIVMDLLNKFSHDAWAVQLTKDLCSEHDAACVLKRFMRELPESIFTRNLHSYFSKVASLEKKSEKVLVYKKLLKQLPKVSYETLKFLIAHLYFIQSQHHINHMTIKNLATLWGPTLMQTDNREYGEWSQSEISVIYDLIDLKESVWPSTKEEKEREAKFLNILLSLNKSSHLISSIISSGDIKTWVYLDFPASSNCYHISLNPGKTAGDVCKELSGKMNLLSDKVELDEYVLNNELYRPMHYNERVLECVLRWTSWDNSDCKNNCLVIRPNVLLEEINLETCRSVTNELKYADRKMKSFKNFIFEFSQAKLLYYKDKNCGVKGNEWNIEDIIWYIGHESKRDPHSRWCITFISRSEPPKRTKNLPFFGHSIAGTDRQQQIRWLAVLMFAEHPSGILMHSVQQNLIHLN